jgi:hypothetical protein|tara:strand:+ start:375 stop:500 length:126 start_codon:yes stop_codon:yes gene_type:complete
MKKIDKIVKDMTEHANNAGTVVEEKEYVSIFHFYDELNKSK